MISIRQLSFGERADTERNLKLMKRIVETVRFVDGA
jgi:hypothetical protein